MPLDSPADTPDDDVRLHSAIACDGTKRGIMKGIMLYSGSYLYVLNYIGLYKLGTGLQETILGKLYAANKNLKAT